MFRDYEVRTESNVNLDDITNTEVPFSKIKDTEAIHAKHKLNIPIFPIELGELVASKTAFSKLWG